MPCSRFAWLILCLLGFPAISHAATREYTLTIARQPVTIGTATADKITINGSLPGPVLHFTEGDDAVIHVINAMDEDTSIHWHGMLVPNAQDGAPGFGGFKPIAPGTRFTYRFPIRQSGTYWYHAHTMGQEADGLYAGMVIAPKTPDPIRADRDYVVLLSDHQSESAMQTLGHLKMASDYYQTRRRTVGDFFADAARDGLGDAIDSAASWGRMRMARTDLSDVTGYDFLVNGLTNAGNWTGIFTPGQTVRLRFINAAAMTMYDVRIPGLAMQVVAADGQPVKPVTVDEFRFGNAETYDVLVTPRAAQAYTIVAESIDREGFALGTLAPRLGMRGEAPTHRPRAELTMADMNMEEMMRDDPDMDMSDPRFTESGWDDRGAPEGSRILRYADLHSLHPQPDTRAPERTITVRLGGNMERYIWTMNGKPFDPSAGITVAYNERVRLTYVNETMMAHPVHLHGMYVQLDTGSDPAHLPNKHTIIVPPGQTASTLLTADNVGDWPLHCHLLFHMLSGMMTFVSVAPPGEAVPLAPTEPMHAPTMHGDHHAH